MKLVHQLAMQIKRGESGKARAARDLYHRLLRLNLPDTAALRAFYAALFYAHDAAIAAHEYALGKLLYEPMTRARFARVGRGLRVTGLPYIRGHARVTIGNDCSFGRIAVQSGRFFAEPELTFGDGCTVAQDCLFSVNQRITIGNHVSIAARSSISDSDNHPADPERRIRGEQLTVEEIRPVTLGDHVWIGRGAHVLKGVTIGEAAVVASGSVVVSDVPARALAMGVPARIVKQPW
jgi:acetyltransferase-like isoleucine patch superfamily enzyme